MRIEIGLKRGAPDARGRAVTSQARRFLRIPLQSCLTRDVYTVRVDATPAQRRRWRVEFANPVLTRAALDRLPPPRFDWLVEVGFKPGVTDNVGRTAASLVEDLLDRKLGDGERVESSVQYFLRGRRLTREQAGRVAGELLANSLIQDIAIFSPEEWATAPTALPPPPPTAAPIAVRHYDLGGTDEDLERISREGILSLSRAEMRAIRDHYRDPAVQADRRAAGLEAAPTDVELECLAQTWSEHCKHKIFAARIRYVDEQGKETWIDSLFKTYIRGATEKIRARVDPGSAAGFAWASGLVSVFTDNAGIIQFNERWNLAIKVETHNTPSALDPYGGAITGIVGCNRDPMGAGLGCELLYNTWGYCLGSPFYEGDLPAGLFHPRRIRDGVHQGVIDGGNQSGIPWARGFELFDDRFMGKPLVFCGTVGRLPPRIRGIPSERKEVRPGDVIVMVGGRIGKDGIHGATFSSEELREESPAQAVQIGDPITQRMMYEFLIEARDGGLYRAITDNGAGGLSSSVGEMARLAGGAELDLAKAPLKYPGLQPWEIFLSEAQERMTLAVPPDRLAPLLELATRRDVEATALGTFTDSGYLTLRHGDRVAGRLDMAFLHDGCPRLTLEARWTPPAVAAPRPLRAGRRDHALLELLASLNLCSKGYKARQYDAEVKGLSVVKPLIGVHGDVPADATVLRVDYESPEGVVLSEAINPFLSDLDAYAMAAGVVDLAVRRVIGAGGDPRRIAGLDNFCWPDPVLSDQTPDGPYKLAQLVRANQALYDVTTAYGVPLVSGKDSMKNDSTRGGRKISIPPTLLFTALGRIEDLDRAVTLSFKAPGDMIYIVGLTRDERGASEFHRWLARRQQRPADVGGAVPRVDTEQALPIHAAVHRAAGAGLLKSSHAPGPGGLAIGLARCALSGDLGAEVNLVFCPHAIGISPDALLFSESTGRFIVTCDPARAAALEETLDETPHARIGVVIAEKQLRVKGPADRLLIDQPISALRRAFTRTLHGL
jgi:phosphoribosylformylglycinamidine synthase II